MSARARLHVAGHELLAHPTSSPAVDTDERPQLRLLLRAPGEPGDVEVADGALDAALGPGGKVAFVDAAGLHLWISGRSRVIATAIANGLAAGAPGVVFVSPARSGGGAGLSFATWDGAMRELIPAPEGLPGPAGFHLPALSPDGRHAVAFSNLTPRPSLWRVDLWLNEVTLVSPDAPAPAGRLCWEGGALVWADADGQRVSFEPVAGRVERP